MSKRTKILRGIGFYLFGLLLGSFLVYQFWLKDRDDLPKMWPEGMVKDKFQRDELLLGEAGQCYAACYQLSDSLIMQFIRNGDVRFGVSKTRRKPFPVYVIDGTVHDGWKVRMHLEAADSTSALFRIEDLPETPHPVQCACNPVIY